MQVTNELLDKVGEVETNLQSHAQFQDRMNKMTDWVVSTNQTITTRGLNPGQALVRCLKSFQEPATLEKSINDLQQMLYHFFPTLS